MRFQPPLCTRKSLMNLTSNSGSRKALPRVGWSLHVGLRCCASFFSRSLSRCPDSWVSKPDGSSSPLLTLSGVSSKDVNPTGGHFGYVVMGSFFLRSAETLVFGGPTQEPRTDVILWQLYFLTRLTTLMAVIVNLVTLNLTTKTNCQVCPALDAYRIGSSFNCYDTPRSGLPQPM